MIKNNISQKFIRPILLINYGLILLIFILNFYGHSFLKYVYFVYIIFVLLTAATLSFNAVLPIIIALSFLEGQGRVIWNYHPFFRLSFDLVVGLALIRNVLDRRQFNSLHSLPLGPVVLLLFHFLWYFLEIFNPISVSMFAPLAATKIYIFPFLLFFMIRNNEECFSDEYIEKFVTLFLGILFLESILSLYQSVGKENFMIGISPYYEIAMKGEIFTSNEFRPFGTTFLPGVVAIYIFLSAGFLFLKKEITKKYLFVLLVIGILISLTVVTSQVRSAQVKFALVIMGSMAAVVLTSKQTILEKGMIFLKSILASVFLYYGITLAINQNSAIDLSSSWARWKNIDSYEDFKSGRAGPEMALLIAKIRLSEFPLGLGPGVTGAASSVSREAMDNDPVYKKDTFWGYDNLFLSLIVEFGYGAFFYTSLVLSLPFLLFARFVRCMKKGNNYQARIVLVACVQITVILLGNWGAIGLPYNPESFYFWLWTALALNVSSFSNQKKGSEHVSL